MFFRPMSDFPAAGTVQGVCENKNLLFLFSFMWSCLLDVTGSGHNKTWDNSLAFARGGRKGPRKSLVRISDFLIEILPNTKQEPNLFLSDVWWTHKSIQIYSDTDIPNDSLQDNWTSNSSTLLSYPSFGDLCYSLFID